MSTEKKLRAATSWCADLAMAAIQDVLDVTESPIEALFLATAMSRGWQRVSAREWSALELDIGNRHNLSIGDRLLTSDELGLACVPQLPVEFEHATYRMDFAFLSMPEEEVTARLAVELDGHDFHERTKAQASRDKKRDRDFAAAGWTVLRFAGSDIYKNAAGALREVEDVGRTLLIPEHRRARILANIEARTLRNGVRR